LRGWSQPTGWRCCAHGAAAVHWETLGGGGAARALLRLRTCLPGWESDVCPRPRSCRSQLVLWLPAVCRKMDIPYCIVKSKSRLGALVHKKTATAVALVSVRQEDRHEFSQLVTAIRQQYNENAKQIERTWGGGIMGVKSLAKKAVLERAIAKEAAKKAMM